MSWIPVKRSPAKWLSPNSCVRVAASPQTRARQPGRCGPVSPAGVPRQAGRSLPPPLVAGWRGPGRAGWRGPGRGGWRGPGRGGWRKPGRGGWRKPGRGGARAGPCCVWVRYQPKLVKPPWDRRGLRGSALRLGALLTQTRQTAGRALGWRVGARSSGPTIDFQIPGFAWMQGPSARVRRPRLGRVTARSGLTGAAGRALRVGRRRRASTSPDRAPERARGAPTQPADHHNCDAKGKPLTRSARLTCSTRHGPGFRSGVTRSAGQIRRAAGYHVGPRATTPPIPTPDSRSHNPFHNQIPPAPARPLACPPPPLQPAHSLPHRHSSGQVEPLPAATAPARSSRQPRPSEASTVARETQSEPQAPCSHQVAERADGPLRRFGINHLAAGGKVELRGPRQAWARPAAVEAPRQSRSIRLLRCSSGGRRVRASAACTS
jgi:hypothetical protein